MEVRFSAQRSVAGNGKCHDASSATLSRPEKHETLVERVRVKFGAISLIEEDDSQYSSESAERERD
jgi:hypothetical protein